MNALFSAYVSTLLFLLLDFFFLFVCFIFLSGYHMPSDFISVTSSGVWQLPRRCSLFLMTLVALRSIRGFVDCSEARLGWWPSHAKVSGLRCSAGRPLRWRATLVLTVNMTCPDDAAIAIVCRLHLHYEVPPLVPSPCLSWLSPATHTWEVGNWIWEFVLFLFCFLKHTLNTQPWLPLYSMCSPGWPWT